MSSCNNIESINDYLPKECPQKDCTSSANSLAELELVFGCRNMGEGKIIPQSWCRACRKEGVKNK